MQPRQLYLIAYDIHHAERLAQALYVVRQYATGGQKSVFECYLSTVEKAQLIQQIQPILCTDEDSCFIIQLDVRMHVSTLGIAVPPSNLDWFYFA